MTTPVELTPRAEQVLETASRLFYEHGIHAVGVDRVAAESGVTKRTLYDRFGSKEALVLAYLRRREERWRATVEDYVALHAEPGPAQVLAVFDAAEGWYPGRSTKGCAAVNARAEEPPEAVDVPVVDEVVAQKAWMRSRFLTLCEDAGYVDADVLADRLQLLLDGALVTLGTRAVDAPIDVARDTARVLLAVAERV